MYKTIGVVCLLFIGPVFLFISRKHEPAADKAHPPLPAIYHPQQDQPEAPVCGEGAYLAGPAENGEPGGTPQDAEKAMSTSTAYAWSLFTFLNRQAELGARNAGKADLSVPPWTKGKDDADVVWESWALVNGGHLGEVFRINGADPGPWGSWKRPLDTSTKKVLTRSATLRTPSGAHAEMNPGINDGDRQEVRMNQAAYETIRPPYGRGLYSGSLLRAAIKSASGKNCFVDFPRAAKEIKAAWLHLPECENPSQEPACTRRKNTYHWRTTRDGKIIRYWGLAALHIVTKDLSNWFWADFIHRDCEIDPKNCRMQPGFSPQADSKLRAPNSSKQSGDVPWDYYHLRGTETGFIQDGQKATLFNPFIEGPDAKQSSCITCHAYASLPIDSSQPLNQAVGQLQKQARNDSGPPHLNRFHEAYGASSSAADIDDPLTFSQADFVWSVVAHAK